jgi:osmoprotectant transport system substrate-binding protein
MKKKWLLYLVLVLSIALVVTGCGSGSSQSSGSGSSGGSQQQSSQSSGPKGSLTVGGKDFTEQLLLTKITSIYLKENGYDVKEVAGMGSTVVRSALENKQVDLYWEYTGTALVVYQKQDAESDPVKAYELVKAKDEEIGLIWLDMSSLNNTYAILMKREKAEQLGIKSISDLARYVNENPTHLKFGTNSEFYAREDGIKGMEKKYGFEFPPDNVIRMDQGLLYTALKDDKTDVTMGASTDGRIKALNLVYLEDDLQFFPAYNVTPVVRKEVLDKYPEVADLLNKLSKELSTEEMMELNYIVDLDQKDITEVAREWLVSKGLI